MLWSFGRYRLNVSDIFWTYGDTHTHHWSAPRRPISVTAQHGFLSSAVLGSVTLLAPSFGILIQGRRFASHRELVSPITEFPSISIWKGIQFTTFWPLPPLQAAITSWISRLLSPWEACWMTSCLSCSEFGRSKPWILELHHWWLQFPIFQRWSKMYGMYTWMNIHGYKMIQGMWD